MCGVAGIFSASVLRDAGEVSPDVRGVLAHRGPDDYGEWRDRHLLLFHWRLSIIDTSPAGHQPMMSHSGRFVIGFNGEIYNFQEIRTRLEEARQKADRNWIPQWRGHSDTEVLLEAFELWGPEVVQQLNGMFAVAIFDRTEEVLWLARDRMGIKPLYICWMEDRLLFASEEKFFFNCDGFEARINPQGLCSQLTYGHSTTRHHLIQGVMQVQPGELLEVGIESANSGKFRSKGRRFCRKPSWQVRRWSTSDAVRECRCCVERAVQRQLVADVPVGVFLSGGVDSSIITALAAQNLGASQTEAFTLGYSGFGLDFNEIEEARSVAMHLGVQHHVLEPRVSDLIAILQDFVWHFDEPFSNVGGINMLLLSRMVREHVTVALAGEGGDEVFGGYRRYQVEEWLRKFGSFARLVAKMLTAIGAAEFSGLDRRSRILIHSLCSRSPGDRYSSYFETSVPIRRILRKEWLPDFNVRAPLETLYPTRLQAEPVMAMCLADQQFWLVDTFLKKSDKASMASSLEVRVPFLDNEVVEYANTLPDRMRIRGLQGKWILKEAFKDMLPKRVFKRFKRGFDAPYEYWLKNELKEYFEGTVLRTGALSGRYLKVDEVKQVYREHSSGRFSHGLILWQVLLFEIWLQQLANGFKRPMHAQNGNKSPAVLAQPAM